jgi:hypothetical protein
MTEKLRKQFKIPADHKLVQKELKCEQRKGRDTDTNLYEQVDPNGNVVATYSEIDSTSTYPPFKRSVTYELVLSVTH